MSPFASMVPRLARWPLLLLVAAAAAVLFLWPRPAPPRAAEVCRCARVDAPAVRTQFAAPPPIDCRYPVNHAARQVGAVPAHWVP
ncbi:MAG: hypothetical protein R3B06_30785 [Kofleriaceae bacterium]